MILFEISIDEKDPKDLLRVKTGYEPILLYDKYPYSEAFGIYY